MKHRPNTRELPSVPTILLIIEGRKGERLRQSRQRHELGGGALVRHVKPWLWSSYMNKSDLIFISQQQQKLRTLWSQESVNILESVSSGFNIRTLISYRLLY